MATPKRHRKPLPSYERVRELFNYDPETGALTWRISTNNRVKPGDEVGCVNAGGHRVGHVDGSVYVLHRIVWLWMTGEDTQLEIDHKNTDPGDNRWENLRLATSSQNSANCSVQKRSSSGFKGVTWREDCKKWFVKIAKDGRQYYIGVFADIEDAKAAYLAKAKELHGEFARAA